MKQPAIDPTRPVSHEGESIYMARTCTLAWRRACSQLLSKFHYQEHLYRSAASVDLCGEPFWRAILEDLSGGPLQRTTSAVDRAHIEILEVSFSGYVFSSPKYLSEYPL